MPKIRVDTETEKRAGKADIGLLSVPRHIAVIMDGNGRWAQRRRLTRAAGHREGVESVRIICEACLDAGVREVTFYAFSTENWRRPKLEVRALMHLMRRFLIKERGGMMDKGIQLRGIGRLDDLPPSVRRELAKSVEILKDNDKLIMRLALSYGGRAEIIDAAREMAREAAEGRLCPESIDEAVFRSYLYDKDMTDPDLLIRTGGESRLSNFLLWQLSYAEFYMTPVCWPEFRRDEFEKALHSYSERTRRFGRLREATDISSGGAAESQP